MAHDFKHEPFEARFSTTEQRRAGDTRGAYEHDKARIIHSSAFRRLQNKTQVSAPPESDFHRTRLTHSLEAAQIGEGIATALRNHLRAHAAEPDYEQWIPNNHLIDAACYAHDLGHPPLGHAGEIALNSAINGYITQEKSATQYGGFEANAHTIRLLTTLEPYCPQGGINPTRRTLLAVLKYPLSFGQYAFDSEQIHKCYFESERHFIEWATDPFPSSDREIYLQSHQTQIDPSAIQWYRTLDASIMDLADEIAYCTHDVEDAIARGFIRQGEFQGAIDSYITSFSDKNILFTLPTSEHPVKTEGLNEIVAQLFANNQPERKRGISRLIHIFIVSIVPDINAQFHHPLLRYTIKMPRQVRKLLNILRDIVSDLVINKPTQQMLESRGRRMIRSIFGELCENPSLSPLYQLRGPNGAAHHSPPLTPRLVCDYLAGMTDLSIERSYHLLFTPGYGNSADEL